MKLVLKTGASANTEPLAINTMFKCFKFLESVNVMGPLNSAKEIDLISFEMYRVRK